MDGYFVGEGIPTRSLDYIKGKDHLLGLNILH